MTMKLNKIHQEKAPMSGVSALGRAGVESCTDSEIAWIWRMSKIVKMVINFVYLEMYYLIL